MSAVPDDQKNTQTDTNLLPQNKDDLLQYYKDRIALFANEREEYIARLEDCSISRRDYHKLRWELSKRDAETEELQRALSEAHIFLYEERNRVLKLQAECDELKVQEMDDRRKIQHLLALTQPVTQEVTYARDLRPQGITRGTSANSRSRRSTTTNISSTAAAPCSSTSASLTRSYLPRAYQPPPAAIVVPEPHLPLGVEPPRVQTHSVYQAGNCSCGKSTNIIRTIYLPNESVDSLRLMVDSLQRQLADQTKLAAEERAALHEDRRIREDEQRLQSAAQRDRVRQLEDACREQQELNHRTMKDYFHLRHEFKLKEELRLNEHVRYHTELERMRHEVAHTVNAAASRVQGAEAQIRQEQQDYLTHVRRQVVDREENALIIREQYAAAQKMYEAKVRFLEEQNQQIHEKYHQVEKRRKLEVEGFGNDVSLLKKAIHNLQRNLVHVRLAARHNTEQAKLATAPEFTAIEERLQRIGEKLIDWASRK